MGRPHQIWQASPELLARRARAVELRAAGLNVKQIAEGMGLSYDQANRALKLGLRMTVSSETLERERDVDRVRLDSMIRSIWPKVLTGDIRAITEVRELTKRRAQLLGLDAPRTFRVEAVPVEAIDDEIRRLEAELAMNDSSPQPASDG